MPSTYNPSRRTIGDVLSMTNPPIAVPEWQRSFSWTTSEVETFWRDLLSFDSRHPDDNIISEEYFLGSIVMVDNRSAHLLLDGQQRLATSAILLSIIRDYLSKYNNDAATRTSSRYLTDFDDAENRWTFKLTLNRYDREFFKREVLERRDSSYVLPEVQLASHNLIRKARDFFQSQFEAKYREINNPELAHKWALRIQSVLTNHFSVVSVISEDEDKAAAVFETLNDRGIGLSTPDLLRNLLLRGANEAHFEEIIGLWREILEIGNDNRLKSFLRHYWISHMGDIRTRALYREIKQYVVENSIDSLEFSRNLRDSSVIYRDILHAQDDDDEIAALLADVNELGARVLYPAILSAHELRTDGLFKSFLQSMIVTFVRHNVIGNLQNSKLEDAIFGVAKSLRERKGFTEAIEALKAFAPDDTNFTAAFKRASVGRSASARYLLRKLEEEERTGELNISRHSQVQVEHIYPQTPPADRRLANHIQVIDRLGNKTLLLRRLNATAQNAEFNVKKEYYRQSEVNMTRELDSIDVWDETKIDERQENMGARAAGIWAFPGNS